MDGLFKDFGNTFTLIKKGEVVCNFCSQNLTYRTKQGLRLHVKTKKHLDNVAETSEERFYEDLCEAFISADIPLRKVNNTIFKQFMKTYTGRDLPDESTLRKYCVPENYEKTINELQSKLANNYIWVSVAVISDIKDRCIINVVVGVLDPEKSYEPYLISTKFRSCVNGEKVAGIVKDAVMKLKNVEAGKVLLFVSDDAATMLEAGRLLKQPFPNLLHLTCFANVIHKICELIREEYPDVEMLISTCKKIFVKSPSRVCLYKKKCPDLPLPPESVITRYGTWLEAALFYAQNFDAINSFVLNLPNDAIAIKDCKKILSVQNLHEQLHFIDSHFAQILPTIKFFEQQNIELSCSFEKLESLFQQLIESFKWIQAPIGKKLEQIIDSILVCNQDYKTLKQIASNSFTDKLMSEKYSGLVPAYSIAPATSCDVERSFSSFKYILTSKRNYFTEENLEKYTVIQAFKNTTKRKNEEL